MATRKTSKRKQDRDSVTLELQGEEVVDKWQVLAERCRRLREAAGLTPSELAEAMGPGFYRQKINAAETKPSQDETRRAILEHFGVTMRKVSLYVLERAA